MALCFLIGGMILLPHKILAQNVRIGLFDNEKIITLVFHCTEGSYHVFGDSVFSRDIKKGELVYLSLMGERLVLMDGDLNFGMFNQLKIKESVSNSTFRLKLVDPILEPRNYCGNLEVNRFHGSVQLINELPIDNYLAGVVESEGGPVANVEFYKAQAILCRTYAIKSWNKHPGQNFNLCDNTHCQSFMGMSDENPAIHDAVLSTHSLILADQSFQLVTAIFHSNSGGETQRASDIWNRGEDYLESVIDPFSLGLRNSEWKKSISIEEWRNYLTRNCKSDVSRYSNEQLLINQVHRKKHFILGTDSIRLSDIRNDFSLKSGFFSMVLQGDSILLNGKGYGHGVGMSQEGAMEMSRQGFTYSDILRFYFNNVQIIELGDVPLSGLPEGFK